MAINIGYEGGMIAPLGYQAYQIGQGERTRDDQKFALELAQLNQVQQQIDQRNAIDLRSHMFETYNRLANLKQRQQQAQLEAEQRQQHDQNVFDLKHATFAHDFEMINKKAEAERLKLDDESQRRFDELAQYDAQIDEALSKKVITPDEAAQKKSERRQQPAYQRTPSFVPYNYDAKKFLEQNTIDIDGVKFHVNPKTGEAKLANKEALEIELKKKDMEIKAEKVKADLLKEKLRGDSTSAKTSAAQSGSEFKSRMDFARKYVADNKPLTPGAPFDKNALFNEGLALWDKNKGGETVTSGSQTTQPAPSPAPAASAPPAAPAAPQLPPDVAPQVESVLAQTGPDFGNDRLVADIAKAVQDDKQANKANPGKSFTDRITTAYKRADAIKLKSASPKGLTKQEITEMTELLNLIRPYLKKRPQ